MILVIKNAALRRFLKIALPFVLMPAAILLGSWVFGEKEYAWTILVLVVFSLLLFYAGFEKRTVGTRRMIILAVMTALSVTGRFIFAVIPGFKPITAIVIITAIWLGGESGFLVGSLSAVISNFYFGQGPWTPFQMLGWGLIGLLAGVLFRKGLLRRNRLSLSVFGGLAAFFLYGGVMNPAAMLLYQPSPSWQLLVAYIVQGIPVDLVHAVSTFLFLWLLAEPMLEILDRIKTKYGLYQPQ